MPYPTPYVADTARYDGRMPYRRCGRSGLDLPAISLGLWQNFGGADVFETGRAILRHAFDRGVTHFDLANNYGPPYGSAEENFGRVMASDFASHRDELVISTKAGWDMWPGPYGDVGGSRKYLIASCDQSLKRMGLDYVDIFYSHRFDADTPLEETMGALATAVQQGKALYVGISSYSAGKTREAIALLREFGTRLLIHQPSYNMFNRWIEADLLHTLDKEGVGCIPFSVLAQGLLTDKYMAGIPKNARINRPGGSSLRREHLSKENLARVQALHAIAEKRNQTLAQMAIAWVLRDSRITSALIGASTPEQIRDNVAALDNLEFTPAELSTIDEFAREGHLNLWEKPSTDQRV